MSLSLQIVIHRRVEYGQRNCTVPDGLSQRGNVPEPVRQLSLPFLRVRVVNRHSIVPDPGRK
jgi:hypothetical protein